MRLLNFVEVLSELKEQKFDIIVNENGDVYNLEDELQAAIEDEIAFPEASERRFIIDADYTEASVVEMLKDGRRGRTNCRAYHVWRFETQLDRSEPYYESAREVCGRMNQAAMANGYTTDIAVMNSRLGEVSEEDQYKYKIEVVCH